jgi:hypothetical protein
MPDVTAETLASELANLVSLKAARTTARENVAAAQAATVDAQTHESNAVNAEVAAGSAVNSARDQLLADLQAFANGG